MTSIARVWTCFGLALVWLAASARALPPETRQLTLSPGEQVSIPAIGVKSYSAGAPEVIELRLSKEGEQFVLLALRPGVTTLLLFMLDGREVHYRVEVTSGSSAEVSEIRVQAEDNIRLDFYFVQLSHDYGHQLGVAFPESVGGTARLSGSLDFLAGGLTEASVGIADQVLPQLDLAQRSGWARVMRQAAVVAQNGKQAEFRSGGEVNVPIQGALTAEVRAIAYGSQVNVEPRFDRSSGRIELRVSAEVADLASDGGSGVPGRQLAKLDTVVNLDLGKSLVLAGLNSARETRGTRGLPGLSRIPILGALFGSRQRLQEEVKNLLFIVPTVVQAMPIEERELVDEMMRAYQGFDGAFEDRAMLDARVTRRAPQSREVSGASRHR